MRRKGWVILLLLMSLVLMPGLCRAAGASQAGMATFTDGNADHIYQRGSNISFTLGPFPCQKGKTDNLVFGIMERDGGDFLTNVAPVTGLSSGPMGFYLPVAADASGNFTVSAQISNSAQLASGVLAVKIYTEDWKLLVNESTGAEAFMPIVGVDGTPAIVIGAIQGGPATDPILTASLLKDDDNDLDHVYFDGQSINMHYEVPAGIPLSMIPASSLSITAGVFTNPGDPTAFDTSVSPLTNTTCTIASGAIRITALINNPGNNTLPAGLLGAKLTLPPQAQGAAANLATPMPAVSVDGKGCIVGVKVPADLGITAAPELSTLKNLYNTEVPLTFMKDNQGSITFTPGLNIIDNRDQLNALNQGISVGFDTAKNQFIFSVKTPSLTFLDGKTAGLKSYGVMEKLGLPKEFPAEAAAQLEKHVRMDVVDKDGIPVPDQQVATYIDKASVVYNAADDTLLIPVRHFTTYSIGKAAAQTAPDDSKYQLLPQSAGTIQTTHVWHVKLSKEADTSTLSSGISVWRTDAGHVELLSIKTPTKDSTDMTNKTIIIEPNQALVKNATYTVYVGSELKSGGTALKTPVRKSFKVAP